MPSSRSRARNSSTSARTCSAGAPSNSCSRPCVSASASAASGSMRHRAAPVSLSVSMPLRSSAVFPAGTSSVSPCDLPQDKIKFYVHGAVLSADRSAGFLPYIFGLSKRPFRIFPPDCFPNCKAKIRPGRSFDSLILSQGRSSCKPACQKNPEGIFLTSCFQNCKIELCSMIILQFCRCSGLFNVKGNPDGFLSHFSSLRSFRLDRFLTVRLQAFARKKGLFSLNPCAGPAAAARTGASSQRSSARQTAGRSGSRTR